MNVHSLGVGPFGFNLNDTNQSNDIYLKRSQNPSYNMQFVVHETLVGFQFLSVS